MKERFCRTKKRMKGCLNTFRELNVTFKEQTVTETLQTISNREYIFSTPVEDP